MSGNCYPITGHSFSHPATTANGKMTPTLADFKVVQHHKCYFIGCNRSFIRPGNLKRHIEKCHKRSVAELTPNLPYTPTSYASSWRPAGPKHISPKGDGAPWENTMVGPIPEPPFNASPKSHVDYENSKTKPQPWSSLKSLALTAVAATSGHGTGPGTTVATSDRQTHPSRALSKSSSLYDSGPGPSSDNLTVPDFAALLLLQSMGANLTKCVGANQSILLSLLSPSARRLAVARFLAPNPLPVQSSKQQLAPRVVYGTQGGHATVLRNTQIS